MRHDMVGQAIGSTKISRRTVAAGVAWTVPAVAVAAAAPAYAASTTTTLPQCVSGIVNTSTQWEVDGAQYTGCTCPDHVDVRLKFTVTAQNCPYNRVQIRVKNNTIANAKWCWTNTESDNDWLTKTATVTGTVVTYPSQRLTTAATTVADGLYYPAFYTDGVRDDLGNCQADGYVGVNDGMHINPCSNGPYFQYQVRYSSNGGTTWTPWSASSYWGDSSTVGKPPSCGPAPVLKLESNSCTNNSGTSNDTRTVVVSWTGTANRLQRATNSLFTNGVTTIQNPANNPYTNSFNDSNCDSTFYYRVYQAVSSGTPNYSNVLIVTPTSGTSQPSLQTASDETEASDEATTAKVDQTTTTTAAPKATRTTTTTAAPKATTTTTTAAAPKATTTTTTAPTPAPDATPEASPTPKEG